MRSIYLYRHSKKRMTELDHLMNSLEAGDLLEVYTSGEIILIVVLEVHIDKHDRLYVFSHYDTESRRPTPYPNPHFWGWDQGLQNFFTECWTYELPEDAVFCVERGAALELVAIYERGMCRRLQ